jgi:small GTP-binding protein
LPELTNSMEAKSGEFKEHHNEERNTRTIHIHENDQTMSRYALYPEVSSALSAKEEPAKDDRFEEQPASFAAESKEDYMPRLGSGRGAVDPDPRGAADVKIILLGDSAVGKSKLVERFMMDDYNPTQLSTFALNTFRKVCVVGGKRKIVEFWDTAGQERFQKVHPAYYDGAHACILVFDVMRKATYQHLPVWFDELREAAGRIPTICVANKIDLNIKVRNSITSWMFCLMFLFG